MELKYKLYPHPVLWSLNDDYLDSYFSVRIDAKRDIRKVIFKANFELKNEKLEKMIENEEAEYLVHIECPKTSYRKIRSSNRNEISISLKDEEILGKIHLSFFIVAKKDLREYSNPDLNKDYFGIKFNMQKGTILAIGEQYKIDIDKEKENLSGVPSIFTIYRKETRDKIGLEIEYHSSKIRVGLNIDDYERYSTLSQNPENLAILNSAIIFPTLIYIFEQIKVEFQDIEDADYSWFKSLRKIFKTYGYNFNEELFKTEISVSLAQKLLDFPLEKALEIIANGDGKNEENDA